MAGLKYKKAKDGRVKSFFGIISGAGIGFWGA